MDFDDLFEFRARMMLIGDVAPAVPRPVDYLCVVPATLGAVTRLKTIHGRIVAETASGIPMIVPARAALI